MSYTAVVLVIAHILPYILQLDEEGIGRVAVPDNALDELDTIMIGGILNSQFKEMTDTADYIKYSNFTGCISGKVNLYLDPVVQN